MFYAYLHLLLAETKVSPVPRDPAFAARVVRPRGGGGGGGVRGRVATHRLQDGGAVDLEKENTK